MPLPAVTGFPVRLVSRPPSARLGRCAALLCALLLGLAAASPAAAVDKYAGAFLHVGAGARAVGMGGAFAALADDASAAYWNPAGLVLVPSRQILYQHAEQFGSAVNYDFGSFVWSLGDTGSVRQAAAVSLVRLGVGDIPVTPEIGSLRAGVDFEDSDGDPSTSLPTEGNGRWDPGEQLLLDAGSFRMESANDWALLLSYGRSFSERLKAGASLKLVYRTLPGFGGSHSAWGAGLDAGVSYALRPNARLALVAHDLTTTYMSWDTGVRERVSPSFDLGGAYTAALGGRHALTLTFDVPFNFDGHVPDQYFGVNGERGDDGEAKAGLSGSLRAGAEYWYQGTFALRAGMMDRDLTFGAGVRHGRLGVDYAAVFDRVFRSDPTGFADQANLDMSHRISGSYSF